MTVKELIKLLRKMPKDIDIEVWRYDDNCGGGEVPVGDTIKGSINYYYTGTSYGDNPLLNTI